MENMLVFFFCFFTLKCFSIATYPWMMGGLGWWESDASLRAALMRVWSLFVFLSHKYSSDLNTIFHYFTTMSGRWVAACWEKNNIFLGKTKRRKITRDEKERSPLKFLLFFASADLKWSEIDTSDTHPHHLEYNRGVLIQFNYITPVNAELYECAS